MAESADGERSTSEIIHRRETIRYIFVPILGVGVLILLGAVIAMLLPGRLQVGLIADWLFTLLFLCPMVLCLFPLCILMVMAVVGMNRAHTLASNPLRRLENLTTNLRDRVAQATDSVNRKTINVSTRWAFIDRLLAVFDPPDDVTKEE